MIERAGPLDDRSGSVPPGQQQEGLYRVLSDDELSQLYDLAGRATRRVAARRRTDLLDMPKADVDDLVHDVFLSVFAPLQLKGTRGLEGIVRLRVIDIWMTAASTPPPSRSDQTADREAMAAGALPDDGRLYGFFKVVAERRLTDFFRRLYRDPLRGALSLDYVDPETAGDARATREFEQLGQQSAISKALEVLAVDEAQILKLWYVDYGARYGTFPLLAKELDLPLHDARSRLQRAVRHLRRELGLPT